MMAPFRTCGFLARLAVCAAFLLAALQGLPLRAQQAARDQEPRDMDVALIRGKAKIKLYPSQLEEPRGIMVFGSGDGGWSDWEDVTCQWLSQAGIICAGLNLRQYAATDYNQETLGKDMAVIATAAMKETNHADLPLFYGGWSMGAVQCVPAAAWKGRPSQLQGLLMLSADSRGRYGLRPSDERGVTPTGPGTFSLGQFTKDMKGLRVAQFHGGTDFMASSAWIRTLKTPHMLYIVPGANHGFDGPAPSFEDWLLRGVDWLRGDDDAGAPPEDSELPFGLSPLWPIAVVAISLALFFAFSRRHSLRVMGWAIMAMGVINLLEALFEKPPGVLAWMEQWLPLGVSEKSRLLLLLSGLAFLALARGLRRHKHMAWLLTIGLLAVSVVAHLMRAFDWHHALAALVLMVPLVRWRKQFVAKSDAPSLGLAWKVALSLLVVLFLYGLFSLRQLSERGQYGDGLTWSECANGAVSCLFAQRSGLDHQGSRYARDFLRTLRIGSLFSGLAVLVLVLRPVVNRTKGMTPEEKEKLKDLIAKHGADPMDSFALLPDKTCYFTKDGTGVVAFALWRNFAVVLADPICPEDKRAEAIKEFVAFCVSQDWEPLFYCSHVSNRQNYEDGGLLTFKVGEDARLPVNEFKLEGGKFQNLRTARNKARKGGLQFQWYDAKPHPDHGLEAQLLVLSNDWLSRKKGGEMTFDLGSFDIAMIREHGVAIVRNPEGRIETFATWFPYNQGKGYCLDLMRGRADARDVMDFLIVEAIDHFKALGVEEVSLGNAPLANVKAEEGLENRGERAVKFLFDNFNQLYGYKSLFDFKRKYHPDWHGRYIAYRPRVSLAMIGLAVAGVHLPKGFMGMLRS